MKTPVKCSEDKCCCMAHFREKFFKLKEHMQLPPCDCKTKCKKADSKKEKADWISQGAAVLPVIISWLVLYAVSGMNNDFPIENLDYQFHLADSIQTVVVACLAALVYFVAQGQRALGSIYFVSLILYMACLWCQYDRIQLHVSEEKKQPSVICKCLSLLPSPVRAGVH